MKTLSPRIAVRKTPMRIRKIADTQPSHRQTYGRQWKKERAKFLTQNPLCVYCQKKGRNTLATVIDHIIPHKGDDTLFWDKNNWQPLCTHCHSSVKAREEKQAGY
ncbi:MAG: HNH endonuclease [Neisseriaceae bacterium]|nr:HNH endonuclease [Neisseriaceae bacterium]